MARGRGRRAEAFVVMHSAHARHVQTNPFVAQTIGWLAVGGIVGAALWALGHEIIGVRRGQR